MVQSSPEGRLCQDTGLQGRGTVVKGRARFPSGCRGASARRASGGIAGGPSTSGSGKQCEWERGLVGRDVRVPRKP